MIPFVYVPITAAREQRSGDNGHNSYSPNSSHGAQNNASSQHCPTTNNTMPHNQAGSMPLGDLEAGHGQVTYPHLTPPPSYAGTPLPSTPPPSYPGVPLPCAPAPNALHPYVNRQIPRRPVPRPSPPKRSRRSKCSDLVQCGPQGDKCCGFLICFLAIAVIMVVLPLIAVYLGKNSQKGQQSEIHCRGVVFAGAAAAAAAHGGCGQAIERRRRRFLAW